MAVTITCPGNSTTGLCDILAEVGAGVGVMFQYLAMSVPGFLIILAAIGAVVGLIGALVYVVKNAIQTKHR